MHTDGFSRLVEGMDQIASQIDEPVMMQIGATPYRPRAAAFFDFVTQQEMDDLCQQARVIVSHAGAGSILTALRFNKPLIVVPRLQKYGEHVDDHQLELAEALSQTGALRVAHETDQLAELLTSAAPFDSATSNRKHLVEALRQEVLVAAGGADS
jgi:UDP-N-acetylglucosamine transferase subunit ALG13